ncbi:hypothetical protein AbraIFM66950_000186 [Aspergillus brasiliensis]|nr:hypothetical protein AbraIFM66950_000186 [Aspergillus brasiliensis]
MNKRDTYTYVTYSLKDILPAGYEGKATCYESNPHAGDALCAFNGTGYKLINKLRDAVPISVPETILCSYEDEDAIRNHTLGNPYISDADAEYPTIVYVDGEGINKQKEGSSDSHLTPGEAPSSSLPVPPLLPGTPLRKTSSAFGSSMPTLSSMVRKDPTFSSSSVSAAIQKEKQEQNENENENEKRATREHERERVCSDPWKLPSFVYSVQEVGPTSSTTISSPYAGGSTTAGNGRRRPWSTYTSTIWASRSARVAEDTVTVTVTERGTATSTGVWDDEFEKVSTKSTAVKTSDASQTSQSASEMKGPSDGGMAFQDLAVLWVLFVVVAYIYG